MSANLIKVAVIGCGHLGNWHAQKVIKHKLCKLVAIVDKQAEVVAKKFPNEFVVSDLDEVIDQIDAAIIATPTIYHYEIAHKLITKGKHVFCEKPMTSNIFQSEKLKAICLDKKIIFQVGHSERFHKVWDKAKEFPDFFKETSIVKINRLAPFKGRATDVDVVQDLMIHDIDLLYFLFGELPNSVDATGYKIRTNKWDYVCAKFSFKSGRSAFLTASRNHIKEIRDFEITNKHGCLYIDLFSNELLHASSVISDTDNYVTQESYEKRDHLWIEQDYFYNSIKNNSTAIVDINDGAQAVAIMDKVLQSLEINKEVLI